jgi:hypothetical protein
MIIIHDQINKQHNLHCIYKDFSHIVLFDITVETTKETTDTASSASFLDLYLEFDDSGQLSTKIYCRDGIYFDKILISEYKLFKRSNKANLFIALVQ